MNRNESHIFPTKPDENVYREQLAGLFTNPDPDLLDKMNCPHCHLPADSVNGVMPTTVTFHCFDCNYWWCLCSTCPSDIQPSLLGKTEFRSHKKVHTIVLRKTMDEHINLHHQNRAEDLVAIDVCFANSENSSIDNNEFDLFEGSTGSDIDTSFARNSNNQDGQRWNFIQKELYATSLFQEYIQSKADSSIASFVDMVVSKETQKSYAEYLINCTWVKNMEASLRWEDCDLFLKIVHEMILNSRDKNIRLMGIVQKIQLREQNYAISQMNEITTLKSKIETLSQRQKEVDLIIAQYGRMNSSFKTWYDQTVLNNNVLSSDVNENLGSDNIGFLQELKFVPVKLPSTEKESRDIVDNKYGFVQNLLIPAVHQHDEDGCSYVFPSEAMELAICMGLKLEDVGHEELVTFNNLDTRSIFRSDAIYDKIEVDHPDSDSEPPCRYVIFGLWSDGCDVGSQCKANRSQVKLTTVHIPHPEVTMDHVFPVSLAKSKADHHALRTTIWKDIEKITTTSRRCYIPSKKQTVPVRFIFGYLILDRPEHSEWTGFGSHAGTFSGVPGVSCPIVVEKNSVLSITYPIQVQRSLGSCKDCYLIRKNHLNQSTTTQIQNIQNCSQCDDWDLLSCTYEPNKEYPEDSPFFSQSMKAKKITFESMKDACQTIFEFIYLHKWTKAQVDRFAQVECLKKDIVQAIYDHAKEVRPAHKSGVDDGTVPPAISPTILPSGLRQTSIELQDCMVGIMHTLFLNVGRHLLETVLAVLKTRSDYHEFYEMSNKDIVEVQRMSLNWCKAYSYGTNKPSSAWVSENFLGFSIICKSLSTHFHLGCHEDKLHPELIAQVLSGYHNIVCMVMFPVQLNDDSCDYLTDICKLFLSNFHDLDKLLYRKNGPKIESASCFTNLLLLGEAMKRHGVLRNFWEGGVIGEGFFRTLKPMIKRGVQLSGTSRSVMKQMYQLRSIEAMKSHHSDLLDSDEAITEQNRYDCSRYRKFKSYKSLFEVQDLVDDTSPIACLYCPQNEKFYIMVGRGNKKTLGDITLEDGVKRQRTFTFNISLPESTLTLDEQGIDLDDAYSCMMLPYRMHSTDVDGIIVVESFYYLHREDHRELENLRMMFDFPVTYCMSSGDYQRIQKSLRIDVREIDFTDKEACKWFVGDEVVLNEGYPLAKVTGFRYINKEKSRIGAQWCISYYKTRKGDGKGVHKEWVDYDTLMRIKVD